MVMSSDPGLKCQKFYFLPSSVLNFRESYQFGGKLAQEQESYKQEANWGWKTPPPPPPSAYRVRDTSTDGFHSPGHCSVSTTFSKGFI